MTLFPTIPQKCFPHELDTLRITGLAAGETLIFLLNDDNDASFDASLTAGTNGAVVVSDLASLLRELTDDGDYRECTLHIEAGSEEQDFEFVLLPCRMELTETAADFCEAHFLTLLQGTKPTYAGADEFLWYDTPNGVTSHPTAKCTWVDEANGTFRVTTEAVSESAVDGYWRIDAAPGQFAAPAEGFALHSFTVVAGTRRQHYVLRPTPDAEPTTLWFRNAFGRTETFHFFGTVETELKPTRSTASFAGRTRAYRVEAVPEMTARTGHLPDALFLLFEDLCGALHVTLSSGEEVTLTENELKLSSDRYTPQEGTATWRYATRARSFATLTAQRTFDTTFDDTYL